MLAHRQVVLIHVLLLCSLSLGLDDDKLSLCNSSMTVWPKTKHLVTVPESDGFHSVFVDSSSNYTIECLDDTRLDHTNDSRRFISPKWIQFESPVKKLNQSMVCKRRNGQDQCKLRLVVLSYNTGEDCQVMANTSAVQCKVDFWKDVTNPAKRPTAFLGTPRLRIAQKGNEESEEEESEEDTFEETIRYSIYNPANRSWIYCDEFDLEGDLAKPGTHLDDDTLTINCPVELGVYHGSKDARPVLIRLERHAAKSGVAVALPILAPPSGGTNAHYTYFSVFVNSSLDLVSAGDDPGDEGMDLVVILVPVMLAVLVVLLSLALCVICWRKAKKAKAKAMVPTFYLEKDPEDKSGLKGGGDDISMKTQTTTSAYDRLDMAMFNVISDNDDDLFLNLDQPDSSDAEAQVTLRKNIVRKQLSGDPSKINPCLSLNQQANALPYNTDYEIDRSKFSIGQLLGTGNFGSVYEGQAEGLFYSGSKTRVAIKTVNDPLDRGQLTALLCEIKILANLELHLNLVNLMGSCTSHLHQGDLWLLLEFCHQGDLKSFLIGHRSEFQGDHGLNWRLFIKWAHSIAKGMEYLSSKRIMHGDLAARNILIGGIEDNLVAKVSDFGLSKTFYDNIRYRKQKRHYVPWKWMALEYLQDACFTMKSDVWSYGVVLWEILSLGQEPYSGRKIDETIEDIKAGYRLPCPEEFQELASDLYSQVTSRCWKASPADRCSFASIVQTLEQAMTGEEVLEYDELTKQYASMKKLMCDDATIRKRVTALDDNPDNADTLKSYHKVYALSGDSKPEETTNGNHQYLTMHQANSLHTTNKDPCATGIVQSGNYITVDQANTIA